MRKYLLLIALMVPGVSQADTNFDDITAIAAGVLIVADWGTTLDIENHDNIVESNPIMGKNPTRDTVNTYFIAKLVGHYWINTDVGMRKYRRFWNMSELYFTGNAVANNYGIGLRVKF